MTRLYLTGGFLGSGKTTAICQGCQVLSETGSVAGVITNDQGTVLVDTAVMKAGGLPHREVTGGCFCCNFEQLDQGIRSLVRASQPDYIFAESVGSCTDIVATVIRPLERAYPSLTIRFSVFSDARVLLRMAGGQPAWEDPEVDYIYQKQLEEADILVVNKADLCSPDEISRVVRMLGERFSGKELLVQNSLDPVDIRHWLDALEKFSSARSQSLELDYDRYAAGEAALAWLDETLEIHAEDGNAVEAGTALINGIYAGISGAGYPVGHLKFLMQEGAWQRKISFTSIREPKLRQTAQPVRLDHLDLLINARIGCTPEKLSELVSDALDGMLTHASCRVIKKTSAVFQPGYPEPTHRILI